ncbi:MAG: hypothetical protein E3K36_17275 [Candidatus Brocadia sp.]|nr:hypothetical protein [Candidatus Brocadia sp.]
MNRKAKIFAAVVICVLGLIGWWYYESARWENVPTNRFISKIKTDGIRVRIRVPNEGSLFHLVDMSFFNGLETGYSFDDAVRIYGRPDNVTEINGKSALEYWYKNGRVQVVREESSTAVTWSLDAYPNGLDYRKLLNEEISRRVNTKNDESIIVFDTDKGDLLMVIIIKGNRVDYLSWLYLTWKSRKS